MQSLAHCVNFSFQPSNGVPRDQHVPPGFLPHPGRIPLALLRGGQLHRSDHGHAHNHAGGRNDYVINSIGTELYYTY